MSKIDEISGMFYAHYGCAMHNAQIVEKGLIELFALKYRLKNEISETRYYELISENMYLPMGSILPKVEELNIFIINKNFNLFRNAKENRDFLAHAFWWVREIEFDDKSLILKLHDELNTYIVLFKKLQLIIDSENKKIREQYFPFNTQLYKFNFIERIEFIEKFRRLIKEETVLDIFETKIRGNKVIPIFKLSDNTLWTICEVGLTQYFEVVSEKHKIKIEKLNGVFPIMQFNPRPKINSFWNYELNLKKKGLKLRVYKEVDSKQFGWEIE